MNSNKKNTLQTPSQKEKKSDMDSNKKNALQTPSQKRVT